MPITSDAPGHWSLPQSADRRVRLTYDVHLSFAEKVRNGDLRGGLRLDDALYIVNRALFLMSSASRPKVIEFAVPTSFTIATPWTQIAEYHFRAADNCELTENWIILGRFLVVNFNQGNFQVTFAFPGVSDQEESLLRPYSVPSHQISCFTTNQGTQPIVRSSLPSSVPCCVSVSEIFGVPSSVPNV